MRYVTTIHLYCTIGPIGQCTAIAIYNTFILYYHLQLYIYDNLLLNKTFSQHTTTTTQQFKPEEEMVIAKGVVLLNELL